jgi:hypothetical protein
MKRTLRYSLLAVALPLCAATAVLAPETVAWAQYVPPPPPPAYVASYSPVYYNGYAHYYYNGYWHYRDRYGHWNYHRHEPAYLGGYRGGWAGRYHHWR